MEETKVESDQKNTESGDIEVKHTEAELTKRLVEVSAENKKRREAEAKLKRQIDELATKLSAAEETKLQEEGKFKDAYEKTKKDLEVQVKANKELKAGYAYNVITSKLSAEAAKMGCTKTDHLMKLMQTDKLLGELEVDESFNISEDSAKQVLEKAQKEYNYLFGKTAPQVKDAAPQKPDTKVDPMDGMTLAQKTKKLAELLNH